MMGAISSVSDQRGAVTRPLRSDCEHIAVAAFSGHSHGELRNKTCHTMCSGGSSPSKDIN